MGQRYDSIGLFWQDMPATGKRGAAARPMPPIPNTGWKAPTEFPNLTAAKALAIDTETYDPELTTHGPGWGRNLGHVCGLSIAVEDGSSWYFPIRHTVEPEDNLDPDTVLRWFKAQVSDQRPKIGANLIYDVGWLRHEGIEVKGPLYDIQFAEALLDSEAPDVSLEALSEKYLGVGKETSLLYRWLADFYGGAANDRQRKNIYRSPPRLAGPYGEADAKLPMAIMTRQWSALGYRNALELFHLETGLIPLLLEMRWQGVPVDLDAAEQMHAGLSRDLKDIEVKLREAAGQGVNPYASREIATLFDRLGVQYPRSEKGNPSFTQTWLDDHDHPAAQLISEYRKKTKLRNVFLETYILKSNRNGRVYCQFHPLKGDENGARSGRFASSDPNLQNIPIRTEEGRRIRRVFTEKNGRRWRKYDYSQIEYRLLAHHAVGPGSDLIRLRYNENPDTDYHEATGALIKDLTGIVLDRRPIKTINFGLIYGMSRGELIRRLGLGPKQGAELYTSYHQAVPFAKATMDAAADEVHSKGFVETVLGRRSDFNLWGPSTYGGENIALPLDQALMHYGSIKRAFTHKALNRKLQGGAADLMKKAMVTAYRAGIFDMTGYPLLTVHDELDFAEPEQDCSEAWRELEHIMQNCLKLRVPVLVDMKSGPTWGDCE
jgi:DNA polymerase I-like protein with 3'-5' exonuclease and polymerase domains